MISVMKTSVFSLVLLWAVSGAGQNQKKADSILLVIDNQQLKGLEEMEAYEKLSMYSSSPADELKYGKVLLGLARDAKDRTFLIKANLRIGVSQRLLGNLSEALTYLFRSAEYASNGQEFQLLLADIYAEISSCYTQNGDTENALRYGAKTIQILRASGSKQRLGLTLLNTGYDYYLMANYDSAIAYYNESRMLLAAIDMKIGLAYIKGNKALVYWKQGDLFRAKEDLYGAIEMLKSFEDTYGISDYYIQIGSILLAEGKIQEAIETTKIGLKMAKNDGLKEQIRDASKLLFALFQQTKNYKDALLFQTQYYSYKDSITNLETTQLLANQRLSFEIGQKQVEVDLLLEQKRSNQVIMITGGTVLLIFIIASILIYSFYKSKTKLSNQLQIQKDSLQAVNNTKDKFFSIISHDLRGPVSALSGLVSVTKYFLNEKDPNQLREMLRKMETSVNNLVKLLDSLLHWALQQRGHFPYLPESLQLKGMLVESMDAFNDMAAAKSIQLTCNCDESVNLYVDRNTTSTIFRNLLNNAIKFTSKGGNIQVSTTVLPSNLVAITFTDTGVGMTQEKLDGLFLLDENRTTKGTSGEGGIGLGLQLVRDFVDLNKGKVEVESEVNKGTTFTVYLPESK